MVNIIQVSDMSLYSINCYIHSTFGNLQYVSGNWKKSVKWNVVTVPHYIQKDSISCGVLTMNVSM